MYDGIKIECKVDNPRKWEETLQLVGRHSNATGEVLPLPSDCHVSACTFNRIPTLTGHRHTLQGSLHKFYKSGGENDDDYNLAQVCETFKRLESQFSINPRYSKVINFEFGVNINLPPGVYAQDFQKYLVAAYTKPFEKLNPKRPAVGYIAEFHDFSIKVYDKGYLAKNGNTDQIRVEIKVNRTRWLDQYGFNKKKDLYLSDLLDQDNIKILGDILAQKVRSLILTPRQIDTSKLSPKQRLTFYECRDARSWEEWTSKQRERKRKQLASIFEKANQPDPVDVLARLVNEKWQELTTIRPVQPEESKTRKKVRISTLIVAGIRDLLRYFLKSHEHDHRQFYHVHSPRGTPLPRPPTPNLLTGFSRWIDLNCRSPPTHTIN
ncbi:hypothetical protein [Sunxiuqinia indica]|uniref:hypothetical protein n=1 Tax=Sunxiuqinia indica TaxID=2692584 RepID=UPI001356E280|nr:hypothetical protein [Sunxiuqinia indica]